MLSATAHAASSALVPCEQVGRDLKSLEVRVDSLSVDVVDHTPTVPVAANPNAIDEQSAVTDSLVPFLYLTPRVTSIVRDVFKTTTKELPQETSEQPSSSPVAGSDGKSDDVEPADAGNETRDLPRFQRQMFRTDI
jgi:hypothetical protein